MPSCGRKNKKGGSYKKKRQSGGWRLPKRTSRKSGKTKRYDDLHKTNLRRNEMWAVGTRAQVSLGTAEKTRGGLKIKGARSADKALFRDDRDGRVKSRAVSRQSRRKYNKNPILQARSAAVKEAFAQVRYVAGNRKIDSQAVMADPLGAIESPEAFLK